MRDDAIARWYEGNKKCVRSIRARVFLRGAFYDAPIIIEIRKE